MDSLWGREERKHQGLSPYVLFGLFGRREIISFKDMEQTNQMLKYPFLLFSFGVGEGWLK